MKTLHKEIATYNLNVNRKGNGERIRLFSLFVLLLLIFSTNLSFAHCDTMDGPVIKDARNAFEQSNVNYVLKWINHESEAEVKEAFNLAMNVRKLGPEAKILAEKYFFETLVRLHRSGEGVPYTGVKPSGTPVDEKILAADKSIEAGNLSLLKNKVPKEILPELSERFNKVMALKTFDVNNVEAGREYIEAYVLFFKFAEGEEGFDKNKDPGNNPHSGHIH